MIIETLSVNQVDQVWPLLAERVKRCLAKVDADCTAADLWTQCREGRAFLMVAHDGEIYGAVIWRFEHWLNGSVLKNIVTVGHDMRLWMDAMHDAGAELARNGGATRLVWSGRKGWARRFPQARQHSITYTLEV